jgi:hypothetical protein
LLLFFNFCSTASFVSSVSYPVLSKTLLLFEKELQVGIVSPDDEAVAARRPSLKIHKTDTPWCIL